MAKTKEVLFKTWEEVCENKGIDPLSLPIVDHLPVEQQKSVVAFFKLSIINRALNGDWLPNWKDWNEYKYYPWFEMDKAGFSFSYTLCDLGYAPSAVGSRLVFRTRALAEYAGKQFFELYRDFMVIE